MKLVNSSKLLTAACALSLAMGVAGSAHATHKGWEHGQGNGGNGGNGPQLSIDVETFCGNPPMVPAIDEDGNVIYDTESNVVYVDILDGHNVVVRVTDVSDDFDVGVVPEDPQLDIEVICYESGPEKNPQGEFGSPELSVQVDDLYYYNCDVPGNVSEWKAIAIVGFDKDGDGGDPDIKFDSCDEVTVQ